MRKTTGALLLIAALAVARGSEAQAQTVQSARAFVDVNAGVQVLAPSLKAASTFLLFGETAGVVTTEDIGAGALVDVRFGYRVRPRLALALAVSGSRNESTGQATASVPSPIVVGSPTVVKVEASGLKGREVGYHPQVVWSVPVSDAYDVAVFAGPSFVHLQRNVMVVSVAAATRAVSVSTPNQTGTSIGANVGIEASRPLSRHFGVGAFARYVIGRVNLPSASGVKVGGLQAAAGFRIRF